MVYGLSSSSTQCALSLQRSSSPPQAPSSGRVRTHRPALIFSQISAVLPRDTRELENTGLRFGRVHRVLPQAEADSTRSASHLRSAPREAGRRGFDADASHLRPPAAACSCAAACTARLLPSSFLLPKPPNLGYPKPPNLGRRLGPNPAAPSPDPAATLADLAAPSPNPAATLPGAKSPGHPCRRPARGPGAGGAHICCTPGPARADWRSGAPAGEAPAEEPWRSSPGTGAPTLSMRGLRREQTQVRVPSLPCSSSSSLAGAMDNRRYALALSPLPSLALCSAIP